MLRAHDLHGRVHRDFPAVAPLRVAAFDHPPDHVPGHETAVGQLDLLLLHDLFDALGVPGHPHGALLEPLRLVLAVVLAELALVRGDELGVLHDEPVLQYAVLVDAVNLRESKTSWFAE